MKKKIRVAVAMSGGVDSGVAAALLVKRGYECAGFHLHLWAETTKDKGYENKCCSTESLEAARMTAYQLGIPFYALDFAQIFKKKIVDYFLKEYAAGLTPNPCVMCNKYIKFGELYDYTRKLGFDYLATGHYARKYAIRNSQSNNYPITNYGLRIAKDKTKDQTYFLYNLKQEQLAHILFPVGNLTKPQVRAMAKNIDLPAGRQELPVAERPESQEICFLPEDDYRPFLKRHIADKIRPGGVVDTKGNIIGQHHGLPLYTIGQRHGFRLALKKTLPPYYVIEKDAKKNRLVVGFGKETEKKEFRINQVNLVSARGRSSFGRNLEKIKDLRVRVRSQGELLKCQIQNSKVILNEPERGIASGQAAVFYTNEEVLGGGIIQ